MRNVSTLVRPAALGLILFCNGLVFLPVAMAHTTEKSESTPSATKHMPSKSPVLSLASSAYDEVKQDRVVISLTKEVSGSDQLGVGKELDQAVQSVLDKAKDNTKLQVQSGDYGVWKDNQRSEGKSKVKPVSWVGIASVQILSNDFEEAGRFAKEMSGISKMVVRNVSFRLSPQERTKVVNQLRAKVIESFKDKAQAASKEFGFEHYRLAKVSIDDGEQTGYQVAGNRSYSLRASYDDAQEGSNSVPLVSGTELVKVSVSGDVILE